MKCYLNSFTLQRQYRAARGTAARGAAASQQPVMQRVGLLLNHSPVSSHVTLLLQPLCPDFRSKP